MHLFSQHDLLNPPLPPTKKKILRKICGKNSKLPPCHPLVKNEHTSRCVHKSLLMRAYLHACVYEQSWMCVLSLHESAVITQWRCPGGGSRYIWLRATSLHFIVSCAWQKNCCVCLSLLTDESRSVVWVRTCVSVRINLMSKISVRLCMHRWIPYSLLLLLYVFSGAAADISW